MSETDSSETAQVTTHHEALLVQAAGVGTLEEKVYRVRAGLDEIAASQDKCEMLFILSQLVPMSNPFPSHRLLNPDSEPKFASHAQRSAQMLRDSSSSNAQLTPSGASRASS